MKPMNPDSDELLQRFLLVGRELDAQRERHQAARLRAFSGRYLDAETYERTQTEMWEEWGKLRSLEAEYERLLEQSRTTTHHTDESEAR